MGELSEGEMSLTIAYITARHEPRFDWFFQSLMLQKGVNDIVTKIIVVDQQIWNLGEARRTKAFESTFLPGKLNASLSFTKPKPTVWSGPYRLTNKDFFDQSNARNTAICLCKSDWIAFVDDLSVLSPTWLEAVRDAMKGGYVVCGAYQKVNKLVVENGRIVSFEDIPQGHDFRWRKGKDGTPTWYPGNHFLGCSNAAPIQAFLDINGYPEHLTAGMGYEDCVTGSMMARNGYRFRYERRMLTIEAADLHFQPPVLLRFDPGVSPYDKSHKMMEIARTQKRFENFFGHGFKDIASLRSHILGGGKFPIRRQPTHEWFSGMPLAEFHKYHDQ